MPVLTRSRASASYFGPGARGGLGRLAQAWRLVLRDDDGRQRLLELVPLAFLARRFEQEGIR